MNTDFQDTKYKELTKKSLKYTKITIYILEYQVVMGARNKNLNFLQGHQPLAV
jgi:hypothetical protein